MEKSLNRQNVKLWKLSIIYDKRGGIEQKQPKTNPKDGILDGGMLSSSFLAVASGQWLPPQSQKGTIGKRTPTRNKQQNVNFYCEHTFFFIHLFILRLYKRIHDDVLMFSISFIIFFSSFIWFSFGKHWAAADGILTSNANLFLYLVFGWRVLCNLLDRQLFI